MLRALAKRRRHMCVPLAAPLPDRSNGDVRIEQDASGCSVSSAQ